MTSRNNSCAAAFPARSFGEAGECVQVEFEIRIATGAEARQLAPEQARALQEVMAWLTARTRSETGQDRAA
jgi:hypothetical protein